MSRPRLTETLCLDLYPPFGAAEGRKPALVRFAESLAERVQIRGGARKDARIFRCDKVTLTRTARGYSLTAIRRMEGDGEILVWHGRTLAALRRRLAEYARRPKRYGADCPGGYLGGRKW